MYVSKNKQLISFQSLAVVSALQGKGLKDVFSFQNSLPAA
jgi:hypothetical protein